MTIVFGEMDFREASSPVHGIFLHGSIPPKKCLACAAVTPIREELLMPPPHDLCMLRLRVSVCVLLTRIA